MGPDPAVATSVSPDTQVEGVADAVDKEARVARSARRRANEARFRNLSLARGAIAVAGFAVFGLGVIRHRQGREGWRTLRLWLLGALALASFASYYNFFQLHHPGGFKGADVFHYYMGSKYFGEVGYFDLYHCTLAALIERGRQDPKDLPAVRDQRSLRVERPETTRRAVQQCPDRFEPSRWGEFKRDVAFFRGRVLGGSWTHLLVDHGYNPSPVWSFLGGLLSRQVPGDSDWFPRFISLDRLLMIAITGLIAWAFGLEAACLAAIAWGTSPLWSYNWIGDAFLRNLWLLSAVAGLCLLERGKHLSSGVCLAAAGLLRLFPGIFALGFLAHVASRFRTERVSPGARHFVLGLGVAGLVLLAAGAFATGRGPSGYVEFFHKISGVVGQAGSNKIGLSALADNLVRRATTFEVMTPEGESVTLEKPAPVAVGAIRSAQLALVLVGLFAFWRAMRCVSGAEAAVLAFALIPLLTSPANYYYPFVISAAMLSRARPWIGVALGVALLSWIATDQLWFLDRARYLAWDTVAIGFALTLLVGVAFSSQQEPVAPATPTTA